VAPQQLVSALQRGNGRWQCSAGSGLSPLVTRRIRACGIGETQPGQHTQPVGIQRKYCPGAGEQVDAVRPRGTDAREGTPRGRGDSELSALPDALDSLGRPGASNDVSQEIIGRRQNLLRVEPDLTAQAGQSLPSALVANEIADVLCQHQLPAIC